MFTYDFTKNRSYNQTISNDYNDNDDNFEPTNSIQ